MFIEKYQKTIENIIKAIIVLLLFYYIQIIINKILFFYIKEMTKSLAIIISFIEDIIISLIYYLIYRKDLKKEYKIFKKNLIENLDIGLGYWLIGLFIMFTSNILIVTIFKTNGANNENVVRSLISTLPFVMLINAGLVGPFNEEILFRKTIYDITKNKWLFTFLSFILFGGAHVISKATTPTDYLYIIPYGALGAAFALSYHKTETVFTPMVFHMFHNTVLTILQILIL